MAPDGRKSCSEPRPAEERWSSALEKVCSGRANKRDENDEAATAFELLERGVSSAGRNRLWNRQGRPGF